MRVTTARSYDRAIPISVAVTADPVASECTLDTGGSRVLDAVHGGTYPAHFVLTSRDVTGLPLTRNLAQYFSVSATRDGAPLDSRTDGEARTRRL